MVLGQVPDARVGDSIVLSIEGRPTTWRIVGIVEEVGSAGVAYVSDEAFARVAGRRDEVRMLRIATTATSPAQRTGIIRAIEQRLDQQQASIEAVIPLSVLRTAMGDHVAVLIRMLLAMAALMATVGALGLASTMGINVLERTREIGVMKTIGATPAQVRRLVLGEALVVAGLSWLVANALAIPLTLLVGRAVGMLSFRVRLPLVVDARAVVAWLALITVVAVLAALLPARRASRLTVVETLGYV